MMCSRLQIRALILISASIGLVPSSFSIDTDKPIEIAADSAIREEPSGETTYRGDVVLTQGTLKIEADSLVFTLIPYFFPNSKANLSESFLEL